METWDRREDDLRGISGIGKRRPTFERGRDALVMGPFVLWFSPEEDFERPRLLPTP